MASVQDLESWAKQHRDLANKPLTKPKDRKNLIRRAEEFETQAAKQRRQIAQVEAREADRQANPKPNKKRWFN